MSVTQTLYDQILEERPEATKEELRATFITIAMGDPETLEWIVREMFEVTWALSKVTERYRKPS